MRKHFALGARMTALAVSFCVPGYAESPSTHDAGQTRNTMDMQASGTFDVKLVPQGEDDKGDGSTLGRMSIDKHFQGDLEGRSKGQMLTGSSAVPGSAGYVAIERFQGTLKGQKGSFVLQHTGTMSKAGGYQLSITVVPDSGSGALTGLTGKMDIKIVDGKHFYQFEYTLLASR
jgi:hypothetical protein